MTATPAEQPASTNPGFKEIFDAISDGIQERAKAGIGTFSPDDVGFSEIVSIDSVDDSEPTYTRYTGISVLAVDALIKSYPSRVRTDDVSTWVRYGDVLAIVDGTLNYLSETGFLTAQGVTTDG